MLDINALNQLKDLKKQIQDSIERGTGVVKGTQKRFGFVTSDDDGQQYLLPQAEMDKVLPGDRIQYILERTENEPEKPIAHIEKLLSSEFSKFIGSIVSKKEQLYVVPDHHQCQRWIFIPPKFRKNLKEGDLVAAKISQHPYQFDGRAQAEITGLIGQPNDPFIEHRYAIIKEGIEEKIWQADELQAIRQTAEETLDIAITQRKNLQDTLFFTIDGASTQDLDDALHVEKTATGWKLNIAIADVATFVTPKSPLDKIAAKQASSIYLPGQKIPMLPDVLSSDICSLRPQHNRLAIVCQLDINQQGLITNTHYEEVVINSKAKLNYDEVANCIDGKPSTLNSAIQEQLKELHQLALTRREWRANNALIMEDYVDYRYTLNDKGKITAIEKLERNTAQQLVEECMLACNQATAAFLNSQIQHGLFLVHPGFKIDQLPGVEKIIDAFIPDFDKSLIHHVDGYRQLLSAIEKCDSDLALVDILRKKLTRSEWSTTYQAHFGLGFEAYTTFTSPIRKYSDLIVHRLIKNFIHNETNNAITDTLTAQLNNGIQMVRNAQRDCEQALKCDFLQSVKGQSFVGEISLINHRMIGVFLPDFDIHGKIEVRSLGIPLTFKQDTLQLSSDTLHFKLKQQVKVSIDHIDIAQRQVKLTLLHEPA